MHGQCLRFAVTVTSSPVRYEDIAAINRLIITVRCCILAGRIGIRTIDFEDNVLTHDEGRFRRFVAQVAAQPKLELGSPTLRWLRSAIHSIDILHSPGFVEAIEIPVRVCTAGADALVSVEAQRRIAQRFPSGKQIIIDDARHELMMETDVYRERIFAAFDEI